MRLPAPRAGRAAWLRVASPLVALALLVVVARTVQWRDVLAVGTSAWSGELRSDWKAERVTFRFDSGQEVAGTPWEGGALERAAREGLVVSADSERIVVEGRAESAVEPGVPIEWRPGMLRAFSDLELAGIVPALGLLVCATLFAITRWWRLLILIGCPTTWRTVFRLTYVGLFFNLIVPGLSGGDVARAFIIVRDHPERRAKALMSVFVDRLLGLLAMLALAVTVVFWNGERLRELRLPVAAAFGIGVVGLAAFLNAPLRRLLRFDALLDRLPQGRRLRSLDEALREYARRPGEMALALLLSLGNHFTVAAGIYVIGHAFGDQLSYLAYLAASSVTNTLTALPISPGGWGVGEAAFGSFFVLLGSAATLGVATSVTFRVCMTTLGLAGGLFLLAPGGREVRERFAEASLESERLD